MKVVTSSQMQEIDKETILSYGISSLVLMENAGRKVSKVAVKIVEKGSSLCRQSYRAPRPPKSCTAGRQVTVCICCGGGNNGGDGLVAARYLSEKKYKVKVFLFSEKLSKDTAANFEILKKTRIPCILVNSGRIFAEYEKVIFSNDLIIDALIGTGLKGKVKGFLTDVISSLNGANIPILSVDCPSGFTSDVKLTDHNCIKAFATVTLALPKQDLLIYPCKEFVGNLYIADIGIPKKLLAQKKIKTSLIDRKLILQWLSIPRKPDSHKGDCGHVFILAGSKNTPGASVLAAKGALRSGAGLVTLGIPQCIHQMVATKLTESMTLPLPETKEGTLSLKAEKKILEFISDKADVVVIGPGLSLNNQTRKLIISILPKIKKPVLIDADGITHLSKNANILKQRKFSTIITPHPGEMGRLVKLTPKTINKRRIEIVKKTSLKYNIFTVLKGASTIIGTPAGEIFINITGNPAMSSGGMGDVLSGLIAGYMAQTLNQNEFGSGWEFSPLQACIMGVYIHGLAGDYLKSKMGERGILASDLADVIPLVSKKTIKKELTDRFFLI
ncbi:MAG: NAD(P)H-hydrate dehydratase [Candidatus Omnitrophica bacterium]|nr:NAD(P)H-hydrate dehydratase [Candidatus Omnitrophota bacterium]MBU1047974.1 NAD(P)H-hydrate dehydratase [Candidatus Omnitrophota bacterium]MBU1889269.1 NAD(P)H-hydrate dehydratase [Candidatus Omnitrophota bacterium]